MSVRKIHYCYVTVPNRPGHGERALGQLRKGNVNLLAYSAFPIRSGNAQLDFVTANMPGLRKVAKQSGWRMSKVKKGFLIQGADKVGAVHRHVRKLADRNINVTAAEAVCAGGGRYGMLLWVKPKDFGRASRALSAR